MQNPKSYSELQSSLSAPDDRPEHGRRSSRHRKRRTRLLAVGAVIVAGAVTGTGIVVQSAVAAQQESVADTAALSAATGLRSEQLGVYRGVVGAHAAREAKAVIAAEQPTVAAAKDKADASVLADYLDKLSRHEQISPERVFDLVAATKAEGENVRAAGAEFDRVAAEQKAAEEAAAKAAAEAAAAEAAAEEAAAEYTPVEASRPAAPSDPGGAQAIARDMLAQRGWGDDQFGCLVALWDKESGWNVNAYNASSGATGIPQALPGSKMASAGADWQTNPATQIAWGLGYIGDRYGSPCGAWDHSVAAGWY